MDDDLLNDKFLEYLETYASLMFTKSEIANILEIPQQRLMEALNDHSPSLVAFQRGRLKREAEVRKGILDLAQNGSSPAQTFAMKLIVNAKADDL